MNRTSITLAAGSALLAFALPALAQLPPELAAFDEQVPGDLINLVLALLGKLRGLCGRRDGLELGAARAVDESRAAGIVAGMRCIPGCLNVRHRLGWHFLVERNNARRTRAVGEEFGRVCFEQGG